MADESQEAPCPACQSAQVTTLETISTDEIVTLYRRSAHIDVAKYFNGVSVIALKRCAACDLRYYAPPCPGDGSFYEQLQKFDWYYEEHKAEYALAKKYVREGSRLLEVGCGGGAFQSYLPAAVDYTGLEINDQAVRQAVSRGLRVINQSVENFVAETRERYDTVCAFQVLEHIPDPRSFVNACVEALAGGGTLILSVPAEDSFVSLATNMHLNMPPHHALRWSDRALRNLADRQRLSLTEIWHEPLAPYHRELYANVLARHYLDISGLKRARSIEINRLDRIVNRLIRFKPIRNSCAARAAKRFGFADVGHTVALVARRPIERSR
jgi:2-polyprenyl-3-methyl-5-hydroxy-6-metoxy-1,4-benzoquinol methylase